jgi:hypothetical protein
MSLISLSTNGKNHSNHRPLANNWLLFFFLLFCCLICFSIAGAQDDTSQVELNLKQALPDDSALPSGINWEPSDVDIFKNNYGDSKQFQYIRASKYWHNFTHSGSTVYQDYDVRVESEYNNGKSAEGQSFLRSAEDYRAYYLQSYGDQFKGQSNWEKIDFDPYNGLPGGFIQHNHNSLQSKGFSDYYTIYFWKNSQYQGRVSVSVDTYYADDPDRDEAQNKATLANKSERSECEWLAHLVWSRLPAWGVCPQPSILLSGSLQGKLTEVDLQPRDPGIQSRGLCRGACGTDCPQTCLQKPDIVIHVPDETGNNYYTCTYPGVVECGSHLACVKHDACFDRCVSEEHETDLGGKCHTKCNVDIYNEYGWSAKDWINGRGTFDHNLTYSYPAVQTGPFPGKPPTSLTPIANPRIDQA